ncbi:MFS transporter [Pseudomonas guariconensis]|uniref:MFS transporter n=1 Tax=Pseudomonas guariconensis TaxID=1288410 RepID=UPI0018AB5790|nr:MFS transporter [Pseudomonas guariconensis]MBF8720418.1 MFS transporter [Pseudomonas guariconensis]MBF8792411.1 MFS transporter [Pseudomonas monteilii]
MSFALFSFKQTALSPPGAGVPKPQRLVAVIAIMLNIAMANLETAIANTALPTIAADLGTTDAQSIWVVSIYHLAMIAALLPLASLGDIIGYRRISMAGLVLFILASLLCGLAPSFEWLLVGRLVQGLSAAGILGVGVAMTRFVFPNHMLGRGMGVNALVVGASLAAGPSVASLILSVASWHWLFLINVPLGLVGVFLGLRSLPPTPTCGRSFDWIAAGLCGLSLAALVYAINGLAQGVSWNMTLGCAVVAGIGLYLLFRRQSGNPAPLLALDLLRQPRYALSAASAGASLTAQSLAFVALPFLLQHRLGFSQVETGFLITPWPAMAALMAPIAGRLSDRYATGSLTALGMAILGLGLVLLCTLPPEAERWDIALRMAVCGAGFGFFQSPNMRDMIASIPAARSGGAGGLSSTIRMLGQVLGAALVAGFFQVYSARGASMALWTGVAFAALACMANLWKLAGSCEGSPSAVAKRVSG